MRPILLVILLAASAAAATCDNCHGDRVVGPGPVRFSCPVCDGSGTVPDKPARAGAPRPAVPRIECGAGPAKDCGSGVLVDAGGGRPVVLTAWHVVRGNRDAITVRWPDGTSAAATVVASADDWDLAVLATPAPKAAPVTIASRAPAIGDRLTIAGYGPAPFVYREASGDVTQFLAPAGRWPAHMVEIRAAARQGDSGGPIFTEAGELAGILWGSSKGLTAGSHVVEIRSILAKARPADCPDGRCARR